MDASSRLDPQEPMRNGHCPHPILSPAGRVEAERTWKPLDLHGLKTYDLKTRPSKVFHEDLGRPVDAGATIGEWIESLPRQLAGKDLRRVRDCLCQAHENHRTRVAAVGGHVIKTGCGPYLIDWIQRGMLSAIALNGAAAIHDFELALGGKTSEDVAEQLTSGQFGINAPQDIAQTNGADGIIFDPTDTNYLLVTGQTNNLVQLLNRCVLFVNRKL